MQTILITGAAGFIGSHLCKTLLDEGFYIIGVDNFDPFYPKIFKEINLQSFQHHNRFELQQGDIRNETFMQKLFKRYSIDLVVHLAAKAGVRPSIQQAKAYYDVNVQGTLTLLECMKAAGVKKLLFASSSSVYGNSKKVPQSEDDPVDNPISPYAATKKACELMTYTYHHLYQWAVLNLRFFTVYGPGQRPDLAIHKFFRQLYHDKPITIYGDGTTARDYTYIADIIQGVKSAIEYLTQRDTCYEIINLGNNTPITLQRLIELIEQITGKPFKRTYHPIPPGDVFITYADITKAQRLLNYHPTTPIEQGLRLFKQWYDEVWDTIKDAIP